jgi:maltose alpha-D-glucosyltransferase/alpha-amylase
VRRRLASPLRDVAGFLRSLDYAANIARRGGREENAGAAPQASAEEAIDFLRAAAEESFVDAYRGVLAEAPVRWIDDSAFAHVLRLFLIEKAAYEVAYEAANRPAWVPIPLAGLARLLEQST